MGKDVGAMIPVSLQECVFLLIGAHVNVGTATGVVGGGCLSRKGTTQTQYSVKTDTKERKPPDLLTGAALFCLYETKKKKNATSFMSLSCFQSCLS